MKNFTLKKGLQTDTECTLLTVYLSNEIIKYTTHELS